MKTRKIIVVCMAVLLLGSCDFTNFKELEKTPIVLSDFPEFPFKFNFYFTDPTSSSIMEGSALDIRLEGEGDQNNIINYIGEKDVDYLIKAGELKLCYDPNIEFSPIDPIEFIVSGVNDSYLVVPHTYSIVENGTYDYVVNAIPTQGLKSLSVSSMETLPVHINMNWLRTTPIYIGEFHYTKDYYIQAVYLYTDRKGYTIGMPAPEEGLFADYGFLTSDMISQNLSIATLPKVYQLESDNIFVYSIVKKKNYVSCEKSYLTIETEEGEQLTTRFSYRITFDNGTIFDGIYSKDIGEDHLIPVDMCDGLNSSGKIEVLSNNIFDVLTGPIQFDDFNAGIDVSFQVKSKELLYDKVSIAVTLMSSEASNVGLAPSYSFRYRKSGSTTWSHSSLKGGNSIVFVELGEEYEFGLVWDGKLETYTVLLDNRQEVLDNYKADINAKSTDFVIKKLTSSSTSDGYLLSMEVDVKNMTEDLF